MIGAIIVIGGALYEMGTYEIGKPSGPLTGIGQGIADIIVPFPVAEVPAPRLPIAPRYDFPTRKGAYEAAKRDSEPGFQPVLDPPSGNLPPHYHPGGRGNGGRRPGHSHYHYNFPKKQF